VPESIGRPNWEYQPDGSRVRLSNGIRIVDRTSRAAASRIEHLFALQEPDGAVVVVGLDAGCRPIYTTTM
jgi:hypothetical protein